MTATPIAPDPQTIERLEGLKPEQAVTGIAPLSHDTRSNRVRLKHIVQGVIRSLERRGPMATELRNALTDAAAQANPVQRPASWCVFTDGATVDTMLLPRTFPELILDDTQYYVRPLIQSAANHRAFLLLALSQGDVSLYRISGESLTPVSLATLPGSLPDVVGHDVEQQNLRHHVSGDVRFVGRGAGRDDRDPELERFVRAVDQALIDDPHLREECLMVAAVEKLDAIYREHSSHGHLLEVRVQLSPDQTSDSDLREAALQTFDQWRKADDSRFLEALREDPSHFVTEPGAIVQASQEGRIDTLLVDPEAFLWGRFDERAWNVEFHESRREDSRDLLDTAMRACWRQGGRVRIMDADERMDPPLLARIRY